MQSEDMSDGPLEPECACPGTQELQTPRHGQGHVSLL